MGILSRLLQAGRGDGGEEGGRLGEAVEHVVALSPQLRLARRYQARLETAVAVTLKYSDDIMAAVPAARPASPAAWASDPYIHAFFAAPDEVARTFSRSAELRAFFEHHAGLSEAYGVLSMAMEERKTVGLAMEGENIRRDVAQTTVNFSDHRIRICGPTESDLRQEIVWRMMEQLELDGLADIAEDKSRRDFLEQDRALLKARLQLLERQGAGMRAVVGGGDEGIAAEEEWGRLQGLMEENGRQLQGLGVRSDAIERDLDQLCAILADPSPHIYVENKRLRLDRMNVVQPGDDGQAGEEFNFQLARLPTTPPQMRAFALVRFARSDLMPAANLLDEAARHLLV